MRLARATRGSLNSGTPLAMASTPVSALHPAENALRTRSTADRLQPVGSSGGNVPAAAHAAPGDGSIRPR